MKIKNLFCAGMAAIMLTSAAVPANAETSEIPDEYNHSQEDSVKNDKLYIHGYYVRDTKVWLWEDELFHPENYYGIDENGEVYVKNFGDPCDDEGYDVEVYLVENGERRKVNYYDTNYVYRDPWNKGLKPYTTYTFQEKITYPIGVYTDAGGNKRVVSKIHWSDPIRIRTCPKKTGFTFSKAGRHTVRLRWKAVKCEGYKLQQYNAKKKKWATVKTLPKSKTSAKLTELKADSTYKFRVVPYGHVADKRYPRTVESNLPGDRYSAALFAKPSKVLRVRTKK